MMFAVKRSRTVLVVVVVCLAILAGMLGGASSVQARVGSGLEYSATSSSLPLGLTYQWHTFYGIADETLELSSIAVDGDGNVYVAGYATATWGSPLHAYSGDYDVVVIKLNSLGAYQWHTFYGASPTTGSDGDDEAAGIAVDGEGNVYVTGYSDTTWQGPGNMDPLHAHGGDSECMFILKLNSSGAYQWHTFYQPGRAKAIALDGAGNVYVTGYSDSEWGSPLHSAGNNGHVVVLKLNSSGAYQWHTYYGAGVAAGDEAGYGITTDPGNNVYVSGAATFSWQGDGNTDPVDPFSGGEGYSIDFVVLKLNSSGTYQWHTFAGASGYDDESRGIAWGGNGAVVVGESFDTWGSPLHPLAGERDIAVLRLNGNGQREWNTFYGGGANDLGYGVSLDADGNAYVGGYSSATWQGDGDASPSHPYSGTGGADIVVLKLSNSGAYQRHTFYGAADSDDEVVGLALDDNHGVFTTGTSQSTWLGAGGASPIHAHSGSINGDGLVLKLSDQLHRIYLPLVLSNH
jgi:hypothetical protein